MYLKNLSCDFRLRLTQEDMEFLITLSNDRQQSVSEVVRFILGDYRRRMSHGDTKTEQEIKRPLSESIR